LPNLGAHSNERSANRDRFPHRAARRPQNSNQLGRHADGESKLVETRTSFHLELVALARAATTKELRIGKLARGFDSCTHPFKSTRTGRRFRCHHRYLA